MYLEILDSSTLNGTFFFLCMCTLFQVTSEIEYFKFDFLFSFNGWVNFFFMSNKIRQVDIGEMIE